MQWNFSSKVFETQVIRLGDTEERIVRGVQDDAWPNAPGLQAQPGPEEVDARHGNGEQ